MPRAETSRHAHRALIEDRARLLASLGDAIVGDRLPRRGRGRDGHGLHGRPDRSRGRARHARRPSPRGRRALAGRVPVRAAPSGVGVLRRRVDRARSRRRAGRAARRRGSRNGPVSRRSRPTTTTSCIAASSAPAASPSSGRASITPTAPSHLVTSRVSGETVRGRRATPRRRRHLPVADDPRDDTPAVRCCRRRPRRRDQRARPVGRGAEPLRDRRFRQDRHRRDRVVVGERRAAGPHRLGAPA